MYIDIFQGQKVTRNCNWGCNGASLGILEVSYCQVFVSEKDYEARGEGGIWELCRYWCRSGKRAMCGNATKPRHFTTTLYSLQLTEQMAENSFGSLTKILWISGIFEVYRLRGSSEQEFCYADFYQIDTHIYTICLYILYVYRVGIAIPSWCA